MVFEEAETGESGEKSPENSEGGGWDAEPEGDGWDAEPEGDGEELILDPELADVRSEPVAPPPLPTELRGHAHSRLARDLNRTTRAEEVWDVQHLLHLEGKLRPDNNTRIALGARLRYSLYATEAAAADAGALRYRLELQPLPTYYDRSLSAGVHVRLGYQYVQLGRFDAVAATDVLSRYDLRDGPFTMPDAGRIAQLAAKLDWAPSASFGLQFYWLPFFAPHLFEMAEGDFAAFPTNRAAADAAWLRFAIDEAATPLQRAQLQATAQQTVREALTRSMRSAGTGSVVDFFAPDPEPSRSQLALRGVWHGALGELGWTLATALEKVPAYRLSSSTQAGLRADYVAAQEEAEESSLTPTLIGLQAAQTEAIGVAGEADAALQESPFELQYGRFYLGALDAAVDVGALQLGLEVAASYRRVLPVKGPLHQELGLQEFERANMLQVGFRMEYVGDPEWLFVLETQASGVLNAPKGPRADGYLGLVRGRYAGSAATLVAWSPGVLRLELGMALTSDVSYFMLPRLALKISQGYMLELGGQFLGSLATPVLGGPAFSWGRRFDSVDQIFIGFRYDS